MGDLRNKINKIERAKRDKEAMERFLGIYGKPAPKPAPEPIYLCRCGNSHHETDLVSETGRTRFDPLQVWCRECAPADIREMYWPGTKPSQGG